MPNPPTFDTWTIIFLFAAVQGIIFSLIFYFKGDEESKNQKKYLLLLMFMFCALMVEYVLWWTGYLIKWPHMMSITWVFTFCFAPILYFYFKQVFRNQGFEIKKDWLHLVLPILFFISKIPLYLLPASEKIAYLSGAKHASNSIPWPWINILQLTVYAIIIFYEYREDSLNTQDVKKWFHLILSLFCLYILASISYSVLVGLPGFNPMWDYMISAAMLIFIFTIALYGYFNDKVFNGFYLLENTHKKKYLNSTVNTDFGQGIIMRLNELMINEKLYVDDEINLDKLAHQLQISRHQLSQILNEFAGLNFFEYINSHRINEAKRILGSTSKKELNIIEIAYKVGFPIKSRLIILSKNTPA